MRGFVRRKSPIVIAMLMIVSCAGAVAAQTTTDPPAACPPDVKGDPPKLGDNKPDLSKSLADSRGVICPPAGVDRDIQVTPPAGGELKVVPPPGTPGGDPNVQPK